MLSSGISVICETALGLYAMELVVDNQNRSNSGLKPFQSNPFGFKLGELSVVIELPVIAAIDQTRERPFILRLLKSNEWCCAPLHIKPQFECFCTLL